MGQCHHKGPILTRPPDLGWPKGKGGMTWRRMASERQINSLPGLLAVYMARTNNPLKSTGLESTKCLLCRSCGHLNIRRRWRVSLFCVNFFTRLYVTIFTFFMVLPKFSFLFPPKPTIFPFPHTPVVKTSRLLPYPRPPRWHNFPPSPIHQVTQVAQLPTFPHTPDAPINVVYSTYF